ncbi:hypothetical protein HDF24_01390 [Mucilaginibacter sp. X4EP1]|uniref:DUF7935 family protein n=1 Tax=Mucilaginibacter sp. X4EP1 TaxID=2723092 RepID=UPI00216A9975|nr:hypothetical protein [Mucilaginibacter sp. X4EP1]MCS3811670.1 hypothetical protein [Mucilaginibacter sp. X4EP1]
MTLLSFLLDIIKYIVAGSAVVGVAYYLVKPYFERDEKIQLLEFKKAVTNQTLPLRLQAYERLVLLIERINPASMLIRLNGPAYSAHELYSLVVEDIRNEYQHNITQQIYVSVRAWAVIKRVKEDTLGIVNNAIKSLPENATGLELSKFILGSLSQLEDNPYDIGTSLLRKDLEDLF